MRNYLAFWFALALIAVLNGTLRQFAYGPYVDELTAHQLSTVTGILLTGLAGFAFSRRFPIDASRTAWTIGLAWVLMTLAFEFGFGHFIAGKSWAQLAHDYNLSAGRVWLFFLAWVFLMPYVLFRVQPGDRARA